MMDPAAMRRLLEANNAVANVPKPPTNYQPTNSQPSYGVPSSGPSVPAPPQPRRWNPDATPEEQLAHFGDRNNLGDTQSDILGIKKQYDDYVAAGQTDKANLAYQWATKVRDAAGIDQMDYTYGNGPAPSYSNVGKETTPAATGGTGVAPAASSGATFTPPAPGSTPSVPAYKPAFTPMTDDQIRKMAQDRVNQQLGTLRTYADQQQRLGQTSADQQLKSLDTQNQRLRTQIGENRGVEDVQTQRQLSPFSGRSDATMAEIARQRGISDRQQSEDFLNRQANVNQNLADLKTGIESKYADLQNASPQEAEALYQSIRNDEKQYDMALHGIIRDDAMANSQLNNTAFGQSLQTYDANRRAFESDRGFGYQQGRDAVSDNQFQQQLGQQQKKDNWGAYLDSVGLTQNLGSGPKSDWGLLGGTNGSPSYQAQQDQLSQKNLEDEKTFRRQRANAEDQQWMANYERQGQQFAASQGLQWAELSQRQQEHAADMAFKQQAYQDEQKQTTQKQQAAQTQKMQTEKQGLVNAIRTGQMTALQAKKQIEEDAKLGFYTPTEAKDMLDSLSTLAGISGVPNLNPQFPK